MCVLLQVEVLIAVDSIGMLKVISNILVLASLSEPFIIKCDCVAEQVAARSLISPE